MELATAALSSLLPKLASLLIGEYNLQKRVRGEIKFLQAEMESMQAALNELSKWPPDLVDDLDKIWARNLKELSLDIEDSIDDFMVHVDAHAEPRSLKGFRGFIDKIPLVKKAKHRHRISMDMEVIKSRVQEVADRKARYIMLKCIPPQPDTGAIIDPRMAALFEDVANLVGIDGPKEELVDLLTQGEERLIVVSIVGVGGLGKTTLANSVFQELRGQFQSQAFVSVSLSPDIKKILSSILRQVNPGNCSNAGEMDPVELIRSIRQVLEDKRYLIVIDDVWDESTWETIKCALVGNSCESRVIVTTRNVDVGKLSSSPIDGALYKLDPLSGADSKRLFYKRIFKKEDGNHTELDEVAGKILKKCGGIPLAIITIASLLASKPKTRYQWYGVYKSIGSGLDKDKTMENMRVILSLSYRDLPSHLKPCLLYLSSFPEDHVIAKDVLLRRWVVEGLVDEKHGRKFYDLYVTGESYFNELVNRSLIQPTDMDNDGSPRACRVHDMILDLLISLSTEENFMLSSDCQQFNPPLCKIRRLSLQDTEEDGSKEQVIVPATVDVSHVRSVIAFGDAFKRMPSLSRFSILRVLDLDVQNWRYHPKDLGSLHHLRYLRLLGHLEKELLEEIGNLSHLKILDLSYTNINELPASIVNLRELESLRLPTTVRMPDGIGNLSRLQELGCVFVAPNSVAELGKLTELRVLCIYNTVVDFVAPNTVAELGKLTELRVLRIQRLDGNNDKFFLQSNLGNRLALFIEHGWGPCSLGGTSDAWRVPARLQVFNATRQVRFRHLPRWFSSLDELSSLTIRVGKLTQDDLEMLGALPVLRFLDLFINPRIVQVQEEWLVVAVDKPFRSLEKFRFTCYARCWMAFAPGVMSGLRSLEYTGFNAARWNREGGIGLENLTSLEDVAITVDGRRAGVREVMDVETVIRGEIDIHPNHPILNWEIEYHKCDDYESEDEEKDDDEASEQNEA